MPPDLSVIIVAYNCRDELAACLESIPAGAGALDTETIVIDNASRDGSAEMVRERFPGVRLIANPANRGFAAANNQGFALSTGSHLLMLNPDTVVEAGAIETLVRVLDADPTLGAVGPFIADPDGSPQQSVRRFPTFGALVHQYTILRALRLWRGAYRRYKMADHDFTRAADVDIIMGAAICMPREALARVGVLDERFFVYLEEMDLARRMWDAGYRVRFEPAARITHVGGVSAATATSNLFFCRSLFRYLRKHNGPLRGRAMVALLWLGMLVREAVLMAGNAIAAAGAAILGRGESARRRRRRAARAARFLFRDAWLALF